MPRGRPGAPGPPPGTPRLAALRLLGRRDYSSTELTTRLVDRGYAVDDVRTAIEALVADGTIDDRRTAFTHVRTAARVKGRGAHRIRRELEARGIDDAVIR
jgi:regulatory protein